MTDFVYSGGVRFDDAAVADVTMDKDGHPLTCKNPITGEELGGGGSSDFSTAEVTFEGDTLDDNAVIVAITKVHDNEKTADTRAFINNGSIIEVILYGGSSVLRSDERVTFTSVSGNIEKLNDHVIRIFGDGVVTCTTVGLG